MARSVPDVEAVLEFWFGQLDESGAADADHARRWFVKDDGFDREIRFDGPADAGSRILAEQLITFPRFALAGGFAAASSGSLLETDVDTARRKKKKVPDENGRTRGQTLRILAPREAIGCGLPETTNGFEKLIRKTIGGAWSRGDRGTCFPS